MEKISIGSCIQRVKTPGFSHAPCGQYPRTQRKCYWSSWDLLSPLRPSIWIESYGVSITRARVSLGQALADS